MPSIGWQLISKWTSTLQLISQSTMQLRQLRFYSWFHKDYGESKVLVVVSYKLSRFIAKVSSALGQGVLEQKKRKILQHHSTWSYDTRSCRMSKQKHIHLFTELNRMPIYAWRHLWTSSIIANKTKSRNIVMVLASKQYQGRKVQNYPAAYADYKGHLIEAQKEQAWKFDQTVWKHHSLLSIQN